MQIRNKKKNMVAVHNKENDSYGIVDMSKDEIVELMNSFNCITLPQRRTFFSLKENIKNLLEV